MEQLIGPRAIPMISSEQNVSLAFQSQHLASVVSASSISDVAKFSLFNEIYAQIGIFIGDPQVSTPIFYKNYHQAPHYLCFRGNNSDTRLPGRIPQSPSQLLAW